MTNTKDLISTVVETQTKAMNSFVETASKFQEALKSDNAIEKTSEVYKDWWESQMSLFKNISIENNSNPIKETIEKSEDLYKSFYDKQLDAFKKAAEFNLNMYHSLSNFGKPATETTQSYVDMNSTWNTLFDSWTKTLTSTMDSMTRTLPNVLNTDSFQKMFNTTATYTKFQEVFKPYTNLNPSNFNFDTLKSMMDVAHYKNLTEELFKSFFPTNNLSGLMENNAKMIQDFIKTQQNSSKDMQEYWKLFSDKFPQLISGDYMKFVDTYKQMNTSFTDTFSPLMKLVSDSKEKENVEIAIAMMDKVSIYNSKLSQMQQLLYATGQKVGTETIVWLSEKYKNPSFQTSLQPLFNEWVNLNEKLYSDLFATDEFSALKAELTTISMEIKQHLEKQFENRVESLPLVVKSEMNELYKTIHDLKQTVKSMETKISSIATAPKTTTARKTTTV